MKLRKEYQSGIFSPKMGTVLLMSSTLSRKIVMPF